ncbi:MAG: response regulator transcription factor [Prosthecobacter sp.]
MKPIRIFLADDHALLREGLAALLAGREGMEVCGQAGNGAEALEKMGTLLPDVALLDQSMPKLKGVDVIATARERDWPVRCVMLSSYSQPLLVAEALRVGALGFLVKESAFDELAEAIETVHRGELFLSGLVDRAQLREAQATLPVTPREAEVLDALIAGGSAASIGKDLGISPRTVETYRAQLVAKFGAKNVVDLVRLAMDAGYGPKRD